TRALSLAAAITTLVVLAGCHRTPNLAPDEPAGDVVAVNGNATAQRPTDKTARALAIGTPVFADDKIAVLAFDVDSAEKAADRARGAAGAGAKPAKGPPAAQAAADRAAALQRVVDDATSHKSDRVVIELRHNHQRVTVTSGQSTVVADDPSYSAFLLHY